MDYIWFCQAMREQFCSRYTTWLCTGTVTHTEVAQLCHCFGTRKTWSKLGFLPLVRNGISSTQTGYKITNYIREENPQGVLQSHQTLIASNTSWTLFPSAYNIHGAISLLCCRLASIMMLKIKPQNLHFPLHKLHFGWGAWKRGELPALDGCIISWSSCWGIQSI